MLWLNHRLTRTRTYNKTHFSICCWIDSLTLVLLDDFQTETALNNNPFPYVAPTREREWELQLENSTIFEIPIAFGVWMLCWGKWITNSLFVSHAHEMNVENRSYTNELDVVALTDFAMTECGSCAAYFVAFSTKIWENEQARCSDMDQCFF